MVRKLLSKSSDSGEHGFTLIELLLVIAIILVLAAVLLFAINPAEQLKKARDSQRISDLNTLSTSINLYLADQTTTATGTNTKTYFGYPAALTACLANTNLTTYDTTATTRNCANNTSDSLAITTMAQTNGNGWLPVNLQAISSGSPLGALPIDPLAAGCTRDNTTVSSCLTYFYRYVSDGTNKYIIDTVFESTANKGKCTSDGGKLSGSYEIGNNFEPNGAGTVTTNRTNLGGCA